MKKKHRIAIGLSGGVDSSVAAALLQQLGFDVTAIFLKTYEDATETLGTCPWKEDMLFAESVAKKLHMPIRIWNFEREYESLVMSYFSRELQSGRTPNPDVLCNSVIKFGTCLNRSIEEGFDYFATGHYAQITCTRERNFQLRRGIDSNKDQSYFLSALNQQQLAHSLFPIGHLTKPQVRDIARSLDLPTAERKDSQGICFIGKIPIRSFIGSRIPDKSGSICLENGERIGTHPGIHHFTIGQRYGLQLGGLQEPLYVYDKNVKTNTLFVCANNSPLLLNKGCIAKNPSWIAPQPNTLRNCQIQIRYRQKPAEAKIDVQADEVSITFRVPQRAVTPGQWAVFYDKDLCLGTAAISEGIPLQNAKRHAKI